MLCELQYMLCELQYMLCELPFCNFNYDCGDGGRLAGNIEISEPEQQQVPGGGVLPALQPIRQRTSRQS